MLLRPQAARPVRILDFSHAAACSYCRSLLVLRFGVVTLEDRNWRDGRRLEPDFVAEIVSDSWLGPHEARDLIGVESSEHQKSSRVYPGWRRHRSQIQRGPTGA